MKILLNYIFNLLKKREVVTDQIAGLSLFLTVSSLPVATFIYKCLQQFCSTEDKIHHLLDTVPQFQCL